MLLIKSFLKSDGSCLLYSNICAR